MSGPIHRLVRAAIALADDVEQVARNSHWTETEDFEVLYESEDPEGYRAWKELKNAIADLPDALKPEPKG